MKYCFLISACSASLLGECISIEENPLIPIGMYSIDPEYFGHDCTTENLELAAFVAPTGEF
jgi:hypothetical protein